MASQEQPGGAPASIPVIDVGPLLQPDAQGEHVQAVAEAIGKACETIGFFSITGTEAAVAPELREALFVQGHKFFDKPEEEKQTIHMENSKVFRGWFALGGELTRGRKDWKEGLYFERELLADHPAVQAGVPMHGPNQWPADQPELKDAVLAYMAGMTRLGQAVMGGMALALGMQRDFFHDQFTSEPFTPFRLFHYPPDTVGVDEEDGQPRFGVQEHTDYGVLTILAMDDEGLEVKVRGQEAWLPVPLIPGAYVVNVGDMAELWSCGRFVATPHRVRHTGTRGRLSAPFFFDPSFDCIVRPLVHAFEGAPGAEGGAEGGGVVARTPEAAQAAVDAYRAGDRTVAIQYGAYILSKVLSVFPSLADSAVKLPE